VGDVVKFEIQPFRKEKDFSYIFDWDDGNITSGTSNTGDVLVTNMYGSGGAYKINLTVWDPDDLSYMEWITRNVTIKEKAKEPHVIIVPGLIVPTLWNGADVSENPQNTPEWVKLKIEHSEPKPIADLVVHFEDATDNIDLSNITADVNLTARKSIIYMLSWPNEIEKSKILYIPSTGKGAVYICKNAMSLEEVSIENADVVCGNKCR
jgi:hypothetical protein